MVPFSFPKEAYGKKNYRVLRVDLDGRLYRRVPIMGDYLAVLVSTADLKNVRIGFNAPPEMELSKVAMGIFTPFSWIELLWEESEVGKYIVFFVGAEARAYMYRMGVVVQDILVGYDSVNDRFKARVEDSIGYDLSLIHI